MHIVSNKIGETRAKRTTVENSRAVLAVNMQDDGLIKDGYNVGCKYDGRL
jgi:hypothetical protein